jgi:hypothetical protein
VEINNKIKEQNCNTYSLEKFLKNAEKYIGFIPKIYMPK